MKLVYILRKPLVIYSLAALIVLGPMLLPGYILTLDMTFTPQLAPPGVVDNTYIFRWLLHLLDIVLPADWVQKLMLFGILLVSGLGMHRLLAWFDKSAGISLRLPVWAPYLAGLLYMINPFTYTRLVVGQYFVLLGHAVLPFFVLSLLKFLRAPGYRRAVWVGLWAAVCVSLNLHIIFPLLICAGLLLAARLLARTPTRRQLLRGAGMLGAAAAVWLAVCGFWFIPAALGIGPTNEKIATFDERHLLAFVTKPDERLGLGFNVIGLHGFWADTDGRYLLPKDSAPLWPVMTGLLVLVSLAGVAVGWRKRQPYLVVLAAIGLAGWLLSMGVNGPTGILYRWMLENVPLFGGYREPQKFMALMMLAYAPLFAVGAAGLLRRVRLEQLRLVLTVVAVAFPLLYTPTMLFGLRGQLQPVEYPADWYALNERFQREPGDYKVLFLPWHLYLTFDFHNRVIANPADRFFDPPVIQGDNAEIGHLDTEGSRADTRYIRDKLLSRKESLDNAGEVLARINVKYVVLAKTEELKDYNFLNNQKDLQPIKEGGHIILYENTQYRN